MNDEYKTPWPEKLHDGFVHFLSIPLYLYHIVLYFWDQVYNLNRGLRDKTFLRRINMTRKEFDVFMDYVRNIKDREDDEKSY